jgi:hypothetical protein
MSAAVIVIADLYLSAGREAAHEPQALPALEHAARFGERRGLADGWRPWLARWLGRADLSRLPPADVAAAAAGLGPGATRWIATPVELIAGLTRVHLDPRGIVRLTPAEQAGYAAAFARTFGGTHTRLEPLGDGQLLLTTEALVPVSTAEPARCAGGELTVPQGAAAAPLLRLMAEIEMWLHTEPLNDARRARGAPPVTALWLWGATPAAAANGAAAVEERPAEAPLDVAAFGSEVFLAGLCRLSGVALQPLPAEAAAIFAAPPAARVALVAEAAAEPLAPEPWTLAAATAALDRRVLTPALAALARGRLTQLTLIANDTCLTLGRHSGWKRWRRARAGLAALA